MNQTASPASIHVRPATPADVPAMLSMKRKLQAAHGAEFAIRATADDWLRDGFGPDARFTAFVAEYDSIVAGMIICSERYYTGWAGSTLYIQDMFVEAGLRRRGIGKLLLARAAFHALDRKCPAIELTVRKDNPVRRLYRHLGFERVNNCANYVAAQHAITILAGVFSPSPSGDHLQKIK